MRYLVGTQMTIQYPYHPDDPNKIVHWLATMVNSKGVEWTCTDLNTGHISEHYSFWCMLSEENRNSEGITILSISQPDDLPDNLFVV